MSLLVVESDFDDNKKVVDKFLNFSESLETQLIV
jgi:ribosomal protein S17E